MKVRELIEALLSMPQDSDVQIAQYDENGNSVLDCDTVYLPGDRKWRGHGNDGAVVLGL